MNPFGDFFFDTPGLGTAIVFLIGATLIVGTISAFLNLRGRPKPRRSRARPLFLPWCIKCGNPLGDGTRRCPTCRLWLAGMSRRRLWIWILCFWVPLGILIYFYNFYNFLPPTETVL